ncbi:olfactomedin-like protein 2B isoform X1 [Nothobranchius furzeri]|uniref:Olfactomedin-like 2Bb n=3 Tax=Nothobranchius furzeri TaxID=105023 RepID=A0A1A7ZXS5_NOTFU|nr:olfactomedin-like protein 2B isoform X1 [Nothobranchius furzeri]KAF7222820.1 olfactomedin-like protein 2B [Nothobranchius furzeri]
MTFILPLLIICSSLRGLGAFTADASPDPPRENLQVTGSVELSQPDKGISSTAKAEESQRAREPQVTREESPVVDGRGLQMQPTAEPLEDELDNQENIISQLLGDYDKIKTVSSGSDCVCRCVVRPLRRSDCSRVHDGDSASQPQAFYTVETTTKGTDCKKCVCMAPPSAVNPCEGEYRFKKLQEASKDDIKLATIMDLLEGSLFGLDLLKLQSVTTKLLTRVERMEKDFTRNMTEIMREKERVKEKAKEKEKDKKAQQKKKKMSDLERLGVKSGAAGHTNKQKNNESQAKKNQQQDGVEQQQPTRNETDIKSSVKDKNNVFIRGVTFYKADEERYAGEEELKKEKGKTPSKPTKAEGDPKIFDKVPSAPKSRGPAVTFSKEPNIKQNSQSNDFPITSPTSSKQTSTTTTATPKPTPIKLPGQTHPTTPQTTTKLTTTAQQTRTATIQYTTPATTLYSDPNTSPPSGPPTPAESHPKSKSRISWTESPADQPKATRKPGLCKDTVASISEPVQQNSYGLSDGAWMRDARGHGNVIYLTSGHYGDSLLEFRDMETFKSGQVSNSYKLPYRYTGTGHVVFNGAFYYNRAFSRDVIRYDLRHRYVSAWTTLHDAVLEEQTHRTQTEVELAVDESGLWLLYPALDTEGFHQEVILLIHLHPRDLQPIRTFRTGLRHGRYGNTFLVCGVLYAVDSMEQRFANVTYAFDTHTLTHTMPSLAFTNTHMHTSQVAYCPLDKKLYAWDNGHQMMYDVIFAY